MSVGLMRRGGVLRVGTRMERLVPPQYSMGQPVLNAMGALVRQDAPEIVLPAKMITEELIDQRTITVFESDTLVDTNLNILRSDRIVLTGSGRIWAGVLFTGENGPAGWTEISDDPKFPLKHSHPYALIGTWEYPGTRWYFYIGTAAEMIAPADSTINLAINDDIHGNGSGHFNCHIQQWRIVESE